MKTVTITIETENAAFADDNAETEIICILHRLNERISKHGVECCPLFDHNGNRVGNVSVA